MSCGSDDACAACSIRVSCSELDASCSGSRGSEVCPCAPIACKVRTATMAIQLRDRLFSALPVSPQRSLRRAHQCGCVTDVAELVRSAYCDCSRRGAESQGHGLRGLETCLPRAVSAACLNDPETQVTSRA